VRIIPIETTTHGRVLIEDRNAADVGLLAGFHGYGQNADDILGELRKIPAIDRWQLAAIQALNRFYTRDEGVVASWMTRQDRELAIADNIAYVDRAIDTVVVRSSSLSGSRGPHPRSPALRRSRTRSPRADFSLVFAGFSQGAAMAYRAGLLGHHRATGIIALGGDIPPDVKDVDAARWPRVLIGAGMRDAWYTRAKVDADVEFLRSHGVDHEVVRFDAGHIWTEEFRRAVGAFLRATRRDQISTSTHDREAD